MKHYKSNDYMHKTNDKPPLFLEVIVAKMCGGKKHNEIIWQKQASSRKKKKLCNISVSHTKTQTKKQCHVL